MATAQPSDTTVFYHGDLSTKAALGLLKDEGDFLFRNTKGGYIVSVMFKQKPVHVKLLTNDDGFAIDGKINLPAKTLADVVSVLAKPNKKDYKWPASLIKGIPAIPDEKEQHIPPPNDDMPTSTPRRKSSTKTVVAPVDDVKADVIPTLKSAPKRQEKKIVANQDVPDIVLKGPAAKLAAKEDIPDKVRLPVSGKDIGGRLRIYGVSCAGTLRYFGPERGQKAMGKDLCCGIELDEPIGKHDGEIDGYRYFECRPLHGVLVPFTLTVRESEYVPDGLSEGLTLNKEYPPFPNAAEMSGIEVGSDNSPYFHGSLSEADAEALILGHPKAPAGTFLFRKTSKGFIVSVLEIMEIEVEGTPTMRHRIVHHDVSTHSDGILWVDGIPSGCVNLDELTLFLRNRMAGWSGRITMGVKGYKTVTDAELDARVEAELQAELAAEAEEKRKKLEAQKAHMQVTFDRKEQLKEKTFEELDRVDQFTRELNSPETQAARAHAQALVIERRKKKLMEQKRQELIEGHRKVFNKEREVLQQALSLASTLSKTKLSAIDSDEETTPSHLDNFVDSDDSDNEAEAEGTKVVEVWSKDDKRKSSRASAGNHVTLAVAHEPMDDAEAYGWLMDGGNTDGKYLLRKTKKSNNVYLLDVIVEGAPMTYKIEQDATGSFFREFRVNGEGTGQTSIDSVLQRLRAGMPGFPVLKTEHAVAPELSRNRRESKRVKKLYKQSMKRK